MCLSLVVAPPVHVVSGQKQMGGALLLWKVYTNLDIRQSGDSVLAFTVLAH